MAGVEAVVEDTEEVKEDSAVVKVVIACPTSEPVYKSKTGVRF